MITEDDVKRAVYRYLVRRGFANVRLRLGRANGIDVEGVDPVSGKRIAIECKGETKGANQRVPARTALDNLSRSAIVM